MDLNQSSKASARCRARQFLFAGLLLIFPALSGASVKWDSQWEVTVNGHRLSIETFTSVSTADITARELSRQRGVFERFLVADGRILLSGLEPRVHWLAEVHGHPQGSQGYVSALYFDPARSQRLPGFMNSLGSEPNDRMPRTPDRTGGRPLSEFEFDDSARLKIVQTPLDTVTDGYTLIPAQGHATLAIALSMPEH